MDGWDGRSAQEAEEKAAVNRVRRGPGGLKSLSPGAQQADGFVPFEEIEEHAQGFTALAGQFRIATQEELRVIARHGEKPRMRDDLGKTESRQTGLARA